MDETINVLSSEDSSGTSEDFEILDPSSPVKTSSSRVQEHDSQPASDDIEVIDIKDPSYTQLSSAAKMPNSCYSQPGEDPQLAIANNGNMDDLQKQMSEVRYIQLHMV